MRKRCLKCGVWFEADDNYAIICYRCKNEIINALNAKPIKQSFKAVSRKDSVYMKQKCESGMKVLFLFLFWFSLCMFIACLVGGFN